MTICMEINVILFVQNAVGKRKKAFPTENEKFTLQREKAPKGHWPSLCGRKWYIISNSTTFIFYDPKYLRFFSFI